jgi:uncharacterized membrane protein YkvA (DUF1232 family)
MFEGMHPKVLMLWLVVAGLVYFFSPVDLIPDFLGIPGRIDDVALLAFLTWFYKKHVRRFLEDQARPKAREDAGGGSSHNRASPGSKHPKAFDAYAVLGVNRSATGKEIQSAYRARMQEYHPDKVAHLGQDLQRLAHEKSQEIQQAYRQLGI